MDTTVGAVDAKREKFSAAQLLAFLLLCTVLYLAQVLSGNHALGLSNWFVGDGITLAGRMADASGHLPWSGIGRAQGVYLFHGMSYRLLGTVGFFVFNLLLAVVLARRYGVFLFVLFPFYLISLPLPSKDLLMLAFVLAWARAMASRSWVRGTVLVLLMYYFRDGDMFISMACTLSMVLLWSGISWRPLAVLGIAGGGFLFVFGSRILGMIPIYSSYIAQYHSYSWIGCCSLSDYLVRLVGNSTNIALRTVMVDADGGLSLLAVMGFISGLSMLAAFCLVLYSFLKDDQRKEVSLASLLLIVALVTLSINPFVQPRYLMPYVVAYFMLVHGHYSAGERWGAFWISLFLAVLGMSMYPLLPIPAPPAPIITNYFLY